MNEGIDIREERERVRGVEWGAKCALSLKGANRVSPKHFRCGASTIGTELKLRHLRAFPERENCIRVGITTPTGRDRSGLNRTDPS